ncbi:MAG: hypothetical protein ACREFQ_13320, partial [Stellaceae bacterium]
DYTDTVKTLTAHGSAPVETLRRDMETRAEILKIPQDKLPPVDAVYDYSLVHQANAELDKEGWKPAQ